MREAIKQFEALGFTYIGGKLDGRTRQNFRINDKMLIVTWDLDWKIKEIDLVDYKWGDYEETD